MNGTKNKLNLKMIFFPVFMMMILIISAGYVLHFQLNSLMQDRSEHELISIAKICVLAVRYIEPKPGTKQFNELANSIGTAADARITIIDSDGNVLGDTMVPDKDIINMENHSMRPEVIAARERGLGISKRYSNTVKADMLYVAIPYRYKYNSGFIRASKMLIDLEKSSFQQTLLLIGLGAVLFSVLVCLTILTIFYLSRKFAREQESFEQRVRERTSRISGLQQLGSMLTACNSMEEAFEVIGKIGARLLPMFFGALSLYKSSRDVLEVAGKWNGEWQGEKFFHSQDCWALRTGKSHFFYEGEGIIPCMHTGGSDKQPMLCVPMVAQGETMGVVHIIGNSIDDFTDENKRLATALVEQTSLALANIQLRDSLHHQATRDTLTGLYNRRFLLEFFDSELNRANRRKQSLGILMLDIDHFKNLNDSYGHDMGDFVLSEFGKTLHHTLRMEDIACRYGGEEFIVLLPETKLDETLLVAEKLHSELSRLDLKTGGISIGKITMSVGIAVFPEHGRTQEQLIKAADSGLYQAKKSGRNRTIVAEKEKFKDISEKK